MTEPGGTTFKFVAGETCLDFINTVSGRLPNPRGKRDYLDLVEIERLTSYADLVVWARAANLLNRSEVTALERQAEAAPAQASRAVGRARTLREAMYRVFRSVIEGWSPEPADLEILNRELATARSHEQLVGTPEGFTWSWIEDDAERLTRILWPVLRSAADLLTSERLARVAQCGGEDCHWLFLDTSRNRSRRWCDMAECGNRAKVRRFRSRQ
jgi:predicted RNA-binding Zn ribbon-like protein